MQISFTLDPPPGSKDALPARAPAGPRIPRLSRLMALAIRFDGLIREGSIADQATLARLGGVTRARLTQIMHLLHLAPDIQEQLLFLPGSSRMVERTIRPVVRLIRWDEQRRAFAQAQSQSR